MENSTEYMQNRTDLAVECFEENEKTEIDGVKITEKDGVTTVAVLDENGAQALGKPIGEYITVDVPSFVYDTDIFDGRLKKISKLIKNLLPSEYDSILVAGIGNMDITADALGPKTNSYILATRHLTNELKAEMGFDKLKSVAAIRTDVLGETGIESAEIIKGIVNTIKPDCVIAVDALAASCPERLGTTVQISNAGIAPGSGVGNHRFEISQKSLGVPVISIGIPTVISLGVMNGSKSEAMFVTPREIDKVTAQGAKLIGMSINVCLQAEISERDLYALVG